MTPRAALAAAAVAASGCWVFADLGARAPDAPDAQADATPDACPGPFDADPRNCGACGHDCLGGACVGGACQPFAFLTDVDAWNGVTVAGGYLYYATRSSVRRCATGDRATDATLVAPLQQAVYVAVDAGHVYWTENATPPRIGVANLDGSGARTLFETAPGPLGLALQGSTLYWGVANGAIYRARIDVPDTPQIFVDAVGPYGVALDASWIYWATNGATVRRAKLADPSAVQTLASAENNTFGVLVDGADLYWTDYKVTPSVRRAPLGGGETTVVMGFDPATTGQGPTGVALDARAIYAAVGYGIVKLAR